jgi:ATP-dependent Clp protease adaptor protein ClpS
MSDHKTDYDYDSGLALEEKRPELKPPKQYKVILINDDFTPMEFVVQVLMTFFGMDHAKATYDGCAYQGERYLWGLQS